MTDKVALAVESQWRNLEAQSGRGKAEWLKLATAQSLTKHSELVAWLKSKHNLGHGYANLVAMHAKQASTGAETSPTDLVDAQYAGAKAPLRALYDQIIAVVQQLGDDVEIAPKKSYVSLRRSKQFALLQPSTADRLDVGLNLKGAAPSGKLEQSGSFNAMVTHRVRMSAGNRVDAALQQWLKQAYDAA